MDGWHPLMHGQVLSRELLKLIESFLETCIGPLAMWPADQRTKKWKKNQLARLTVLLTLATVTKLENIESHTDRYTGENGQTL